jgi:hypothetical protein
MGVGVCLFQQYAKLPQRVTRRHFKGAVWLAINQAHKAASGMNCLVFFLTSVPRRRRHVGRPALHLKDCSELFMRVVLTINEKNKKNESLCSSVLEYREASAFANDIPESLKKVNFFLSEESVTFRFLRAACLANIKGSVGLILAKASDMRISIPLDLSSRFFIPPPRFIRSRRPTTLLAPSFVFSPLRSA